PGAPLEPERRLELGHGPYGRPELRLSEPEARTEPERRPVEGIDFRDRRKPLRPAVHGGKPLPDALRRGVDLDRRFVSRHCLVLLLARPRKRRGKAEHGERQAEEYDPRRRSGAGSRRTARSREARARPAPRIAGGRGG